MDINSLLSGSIGQQIVGTVAKQLGIDESQAQSAVSTAVPVLLSALNKNAQNGGTEAISKALEKHDGGILDNITSLFGESSNQQEGLGILSHIFGDKQQDVETVISQKSGLNTSQVTQILALLAPIVMGFLGKQKVSQGLDSNGITSLLEGLFNSSDSSEGIKLGGLEKLLDKDGDGKLGASDVMGMIGGFFKK